MSNDFQIFSHAKIDDQILLPMVFRCTCFVRARAPLKGRKMVRSVPIAATCFLFAKAVEQGPTLGACAFLARHKQLTRS